MQDTLIIVGSARSNGHTMRVARALQAEVQADLVDLQDYQIGYFRYDQHYPEGDDFLDFIEASVLPYRQLVFASPVYWYSMSAQMKTFFDRLSDLLKSRKDLGRQLRGKQLSVLSCSGDDEVFESFFLPFKLSAAYLGMAYSNEWHSWVDEAGEMN
ncbi:MAG: NAD(P)H-dependent oxidoreductase, partial [Bacteroidota bacterium]